MSDICPVCLEIQPSGGLLPHVRADHVRDIGPSWIRPVAAGPRRWPKNVATEPCGGCDHYVGVHETVGACSTPGCACPWPILPEDTGEHDRLVS
jgi:hypothetical protein